MSFATLLVCSRTSGSILIVTTALLLPPNLKKSDTSSSQTNSKMLCSSQNFASSSRLLKSGMLFFISSSLPVSSPLPVIHDSSCYQPAGTPFQLKNECQIHPVTASSEQCPSACR